MPVSENRNRSLGSPKSMSNNLSYFFNKRSGNITFNVQAVGSSKFGAEITIDAGALNLDTDGYVEANWNALQQVEEEYVDENGETKTKPKYETIEEAKVDYKKKFSWVPSKER